MEIIKYIILGFIQGFTETIPVSSSGHLMIIKTLMNVMLGMQAYGLSVKDTTESSCVAELMRRYQALTQK